MQNFQEIDGRNLRYTQHRRQAEWSALDAATFALRGAQQALATQLGRASINTQRVQQTQCFSDKARCADSKVLTNNIVMVIGPTPPGTGVM
jgi:hypothetical protein